MTPINTAIEALIPNGALNTGKPIKVASNVAIAILDLIEKSLQFEAGYEFDWEACRAAVEYYSQIVAPPEAKGQCAIVAMTGRSLSQKRTEGRYSDSPHTYQDRTIVNSVQSSIPTLMLFRQNGEVEDGWRGTPFWWPVLFPPIAAAPSIFASSLRPDLPDEDEE